MKVALSAIGLAISCYTSNRKILKPAEAKEQLKVRIFESK